MVFEIDSIYYPSKNLNTIRVAKFLTPMQPTKVHPQTKKLAPMYFPAWKYCRPRPDKNDPAR